VVSDLERDEVAEIELSEKYYGVDAETTSGGHED